MIKVYDRRLKKIIFEKEQNKKGLEFLYNTIIGRILLKVLTCKIISKIYSVYMKSRISKNKIKKFVDKYNIELEEINYTSFNDFFTRKKQNMKIDKEKNSFISVAESKLLVYKIERNINLKIKNSTYSITDLIKNSNIAQEYKDGICMVFRLELDNYHRYCYVDNGYQENNIKINGILHSVRPITYEKYKVFSENSREWTILHTENFGDIIQIEVGALQVGKIKNHYQNNHFEKGQEKGFFEYGGSTIILLVQKNQILIDEDIVENSKLAIETCVELGEKIGIKIEGGNKC